MKLVAMLLLSAALAMFATVLPVECQTSATGGVAGVVIDPRKSLVPDAYVEIKDTGKGTIQSTKTDHEGVYRFFFLAPGSYTLTVRHSGFRQETRNVNVLLGPPVSVNVTLEIARANASMTVTDEAPLVQAENGDVSATMNRKQISEVPNPGNDLTYVVQTAPGVVMNTDRQGSANFSILGMPGYSYLHTMDGMNDNDNAFNLSQVGALILLLGQNQVQEATVVSTGYSGQFGGAAGGNINYITKSGSNDFHGNAQYYWNGRAFNANSWVNKVFGEPRPFSIANQWAGSFGGPIINNKLFFFVDTEGLRLLIPQNFFVTIPSHEFEAATIANIDLKFGSSSASDAFYKRIFNLYKEAPGASSALSGGFVDEDPTGCAGFVGPNGLGTDVPCALHFLSTRGRASQDTLTSLRLDWNVTTKDRAFLRVQYDRGHSAAFTNEISSVFDVDLNQPWWQAQILETHTFGSSAANQFLVAGSYFAQIYQRLKPTEARAALPISLDFQTGPFNGLAGGPALGFGRYNTQFQVSEDVVKISGTHKFGFGANFERIYWKSLAGGTLGLNVQTLRAFYEGGVDPASPDTDFTALSESFSSGRKLPISFLNFAVYAEDEWHARAGLALTFALRAEHYSNPSCRTGCFARLAVPFESLSHDPDQPYNQAILINQKKAFEHTDNFLWSPRFSFAWQPLGLLRNTVIRGGVGIFYDPLPGNLQALLSGNPPLVNSYTVVGNNLTPDETQSLSKDASASNAAFVNGFNAGQTLAQIRAADPNVTPPGISSPGKRTNSPQYQRWSLEWEQGLGVNTSITAGYFGYHGIHGLVVDPDANAFGFGALPAGLCTSPPVPPCADPRFSGVTQISTDAVSNYHGGVISFQHRFSRWTQGLFQANYSYGHALDENSGGGLFIATFTSAGLTSPQDPTNPRGSYGSADHDVRHSFNANYVWDIPVKAALRGRGWDGLVNGWQISGTVFARTGFPYTVFDFAESGSLVPNNYFGLLYAVPSGPLGSGPPCGRGATIPVAPHPCQPSQVLADGTTPNPGARFIQSGCATGFNVGNLPSASGPCDGAAVSFAQGRNRFRGPGYFNTDLAVTKRTKIPGWEAAELGVGFQFFNLFNHPNFGFPDAGLSSPSFGQIFNVEQPPTSILGSGLGGNASARMIQLKIQLQF